MMPDPEALARIQIDRLLIEAGWLVVDRHEANIFAGRGIAIREFSIPGAGEADYLLIADKRAIGIIEAKAQGITLSGVEPQTKAYAEGIPGFAVPWLSPLPMLYESTGVETRFTNMLDPEPRSRRVFAFHRPEALVAWAKAALESGSQFPHGYQGQHGAIVPAKVAEGEAPYDAEPATLAGRLQRLPLSVDDPTLWPAQRVAIINLDLSLRQHKPCALIQMATDFNVTTAMLRLDTSKHLDWRRTKK